MSIDVSKYVRVATLDDLNTLVRFSRKFQKNSPYKGMEFSNERTRQTLEAIIRTNGLKGIVLVALKGSEAVGMIVAMADYPPMSSDLMSTELAWWIEPEHRKSRRSLLLFETYEAWAKKIGCKYIHSAYLEGSTELTSFYNRKGYKKVETSFLKGAL
ncbi:MAG: GNAT family N-acetyltransferase [Candidatus Obscuribacterales bacterium]